MTTAVGQFISAMATFIFVLIQKNATLKCMKSPSDGDELSVMAIGLGWTDGFNRNVQLVDLSSGKYCDRNNEKEESNFPGLYYLNGQYVDEDSIIVCGGFNGSQFASDKCYNYSISLNKWYEFGTLTEPRSGAASVVLEDGNIWVTGGVDKNEDGTWTSLSSTDIIDKTSLRITSGPNLTSSLSGHCLIQYNTSHTMLIGGYDGTPHTRSVAFYNWETSHWIDGPKLKYQHAAHGCTKSITKDGDIRIFVFGGYPDFDKVEILKDGEWMSGEDIPEKYGITQAVAFNKYAILTGRYQDYPHEYSWKYDMEENKWSRFFEMDPPIKDHFATLVPRKYCKQSTEKIRKED